jgi:hypothetical protein
MANATTSPSARKIEMKNANTCRRLIGKCSPKGSGSIIAITNTGIQVSNVDVTLLATA